MIVNASQDYVNVKLGEEYGFPRGFPILWKKDLGIVEYKGFYPKFSNDDVGQKTMESDMFKGAKTMSIEKKVSGFLGMVIATEFEGEVYWLPVTKRSAMGEMVDNFAEIITPYMTRELVEAMVERGVHIGGEVISKRPGAWSESDGRRIYCYHGWKGTHLYSWGGI